MPGAPQRSRSTGVRQRDHRDGQCGTAGEAFALYMLPIDPKNVPTEGAAGEFYAARAAYLTAAAKCYEEIQAKQSSGEATR